jgi:Subtilase family
MPSSNRILVKLRPTAGLAAADPRANLRPLHDEAPQGAGFGLAAAPAWYIADLRDGGPTPWDLAHAQVADQLGIDESAVVFAEPDLQQSFNDGSTPPGAGLALAAQPDCTPVPQDSTHNKVVGPQDGWHLDDAFSQLRSARNSVSFAAPRTRIAHIDVGYDPDHTAKPENILVGMDRSFADGDDNPNTAADPARGHAIPDNTGHGTGTIGILAGGKVAALGNDYLGGAPNAEILPLRVSNSVVLFHTSALARALQYAVDQRCDVVSMSMGGLPSAAWNDAVNNAYEAGMCIVAAAGNNIAGLPSPHVVYPARYHRVIAACGVMADGRPYHGIARNDIQGSWGPDSCMTQAIAAYTPNIPWPIYHCKDKIRMNGEGTSSATPQIAAAVALWYERYKNVLPRDWRRVEAVRNALFTSAKAADPGHCGHGILQANAALAIAPNLMLAKTPSDKDSFAFLRVITGLGIIDMPPRELMFNLELTQRYLDNADLQKIVPDPEGQVGDAALKQFMEAVIQDPKASVALRRHVANRYSSISGAIIQGAPPEIVAAEVSIPETVAATPDPPFRSVRAYAVDPSFSTRLDTTGISEIVLKVRWEKLAPGPKGEYLEVVDLRPDKQIYPAVDLDDPRLLAQSGCPPAEGSPVFHQQMVYAVAMNTIEHFEVALGRPVLWRPDRNPANEFDDSRFVQRLRVRPHALQQANAYYSPQDVALLFGYFQAGADDPGDHVPGSLVYSCLSHDIIAHETTHAILDGMHRRFQEASNPDVLALHEAFADIVALMQHFTIPEILQHQISHTRGNLESESILGSLAVQFGRAIGGRGALRDAIGRINDKGEWTRIKPDPSDYQARVMSPHARGALLVAAIFDAFLAIYNTRTADLLRIYTGGSGVLPSGAIHPDLVHRLADEASKSAGHVLNMCIRALDYVPPVDITFGDYLRAIITADSDLVPEDKFNYRIAFVEAFRKRGIYPLGLKTLSVDTLRWEGLSLKNPLPEYEKIVRQLKRYADKCFYLKDREELFKITREHRSNLHATLEKVFAQSPQFAATLGLDPQLKFEVHELRRSIRISPDGSYVPQIIVALTQTRPMSVPGAASQHSFRGGATIVVDLSQPAVKYAIVKRINSANREQRTVEFIQNALSDPLLGLLLAADRKEPFAALHSLGEVDL